MSAEGILIIVFGSLVLLAVLAVLALLLRAEFVRSKAEAGTKDYSKDIYQAVNAAMQSFTASINDQFRTLSNNLNIAQKNSSDSLVSQLRGGMSDLQKQTLDLVNLTQKQLSDMSLNLSNSIKDLRDDNSDKLEKMRQVVDEKLQKTLNERLTASFKQVSDNLDKVMGVVRQMQDVSSQVSNLQRVLTNVKTKGILGETQLGNILEDILTPEQYEKNIITKRGSRDPVEFAVRLPGSKNEPVYLPIDSKFPLERYTALKDAYDSGDRDKIKSAKNDLRYQITAEAKDINSKYLDSPHTTDFGVLFLPTEALYAEVMDLGVSEELQRGYKIMIAGPSTMAALLNSLSLGFRTLALQKNSRMIADVLTEVKTEFDKFQKALTDAQDKLNSASDSLEKVVGTRTRMLSNKLKKAESFIDEGNKAAVQDDDDSKSR